MNEKFSTWMKHKNKNNDVVGLNWCWTWPFVESIHEAFIPSKCRNLWVWKNEKNKNKKEVQKQFGLDGIGPPYPKVLYSLPDLGGLEKCSRPHINGNGAIGTSQCQQVFIPLFFLLSFSSSPLLFLLYLLLFISTSSPPPSFPPCLLLFLGLQLHIVALPFFFMSNFAQTTMLATKGKKNIRARREAPCLSHWCARRQPLLAFLGGVDGQHQSRNLELSTFLDNGGALINDNVKDNDVVNRALTWTGDGRLLFMLTTMVRKKIPCSPLLVFSLLFLQGTKKEKRGWGERKR